MQVVDVSIYFNHTANFTRGYKSGDELQFMTKLEKLQTEMDEDGIKKLLDRVFTELNTNYFLGRSMSVGDIAVIGETAYTCEWNGWSIVQLEMTA